MRPSLIALATLLLLPGCGSTREDQTDQQPRSDQLIGRSCTAGSAAVRHARVVLRVDLDGDGRRDQLRRTADDDAGCPSVLVASPGSRVSGVAVPVGSRVSRVSVPGHRSDLVLATRATATSTSYRLVVLDEGRLRRVTDPDGGPVLPTTPRGTGRGLLSARCTAGGLVVDRAVPHQPPGIAFAWDVTTRTYRLDGAVARPVGRTVTQSNVLPDQLQEKAPGLASPSVLVAGCR